MRSGEGAGLPTEASVRSPSGRGVEATHPGVSSLSPLPLPSWKINGKTPPVRTGKEKETPEWAPTPLSPMLARSLVCPET